MSGGKEFYENRIRGIPRDWNAGRVRSDRATLRETENGEVLTSFRDTSYQHLDDHIINQREMLIGGKVFHVTSVFQMDATATPTDKLLSLIDTDLKKEAHSA